MGNATATNDNSGSYQPGLGWYNGTDPANNGATYTPGWGWAYTPSTGYTNSMSPYDNPAYIDAITDATINPPKEVVTGTSNKVNLLKADHNVNRFNPPPHTNSRRLSPTALTQYNFTQSNSAARIENARRELEAAGTFNKRGFIIQDPDTAKYGQPASNIDELWGFQFMYNPTSIGYANQTSTAFDWQNQDDIANLMIGTQSISLELLLNRTVDAYELRRNITNPTGYPRVLTEKEKRGILHRGTDYDLEFLYRTANGDPIDRSPLTKGNSDLPTADFGYIYGNIMWLILHEHLRYKVYITGISVNHAVFTDKMVPVMTNVSISFMRVPAPVFGGTQNTTDFLKVRTSDSNPALKSDPPLNPVS